jgi:alcohol dehydrogenase class IV
MSMTRDHYKLLNVQIGKEESAELISGGIRVEGPGIPGRYYYAPTIFADVQNKMRIAQDGLNEKGRLNMQLAAAMAGLAFTTAPVAQALGMNTAGMTEREAALSAADGIEALMKKVGHPMQLRELGVPEDSLAICAFHAIADRAVLFNGRPVNDPNEVLALYQQAY